MKYLSLAFCVASAWAADTPSVRMAEFTPGPDGAPAGWKRWAPREEIAPRTWVDNRRGHAAPGSLAIAGISNPAVFGGWEYTAVVEPGKWYRLSAWYTAVGVAFEQGQVLARLDWADAAGKRTGQPDYGWVTTPEAGWNKVTLDAPAPPQAAAVRVQLYLANAPQGTVWWDDLALEPVAAPAPRPVTVASVNLRPTKTGSAEESVRQFMALIESKAPAKTDLILLPEGITVVGTGKKYLDVAETIPGRTTAVLGETARRRKTYIAAGIIEREGNSIYNTAVLIDRQGSVAGTYRKVYLPREEYEGGLTPGSDYPVFETDFGRVGMMICWDVQYADPARALALRGAELILLPIWGGSVPLGKARAIENHVFLASSGYDYPTHIIDPMGEQLAVAEPGAIAVTTIDLNRRYVDPWLGHMRARFMKELRLDVPLRH